MRDMNTRRIQLGQLGEIRQGLTLSRYIDPQGPEKRILQVANLTGHQVIPRDDDRREHLDEARAQEFYARPGQVLVSLRGSSLKAGVVTGELDAVVSSSLVAITVNPDLADPFFLAGLLNSQAMEQQVMPLFSGLTVQGIPLSRFKDLAIALPALPQQRQLATAMQALSRYQQETAAIIALRGEELEAHLTTFVIKERG